MCESFPVVRAGRLIEVFDRQSGERHRTTYKESDAIMALLQKECAKVEALIVGKLRDSGLAEEVSNPRSVKNRLDLRPASRSRALGALFDFRDMLLRAGRFTVVLRASAAVCADEPVLGFAENVQDQHSKVWVRVACVEVKDKRATDVVDRDLVDFKKLADDISDVALDALIAPYQDCFERSTERELNVSADERFSFYAIGTDSESFHSLYEQLDSGDRLRDHKENEVTEKLISLASECSILNGHGGKDLSETLEKVATDADMKLVLFEDLRFYRGLFVGHQGEKEASYIGLTHFPFAWDGSPTKALTKDEVLRAQPAFRISAALMSAFVRSN